MRSASSYAGTTTLSRTSPAARAGPSGPGGPWRQLAEQRPAVADEAHRAGGEERDELGLDQGGRGREAGAREQAPQHDHVDRGGQHRHADEGRRASRPSARRGRCGTSPPGGARTTARWPRRWRPGRPPPGSSRARWRNSTSSPTSTSVGTSATRASRRSRPLSRCLASVSRSDSAGGSGSSSSVPSSVGSAGHRRVGANRAWATTDGATGRRISSTRPASPSSVRAYDSALDAGAAVGQLDVGVGRDHHHEVGRHPVRPLGPGDLPVGEVRHLHQHRDADLVDVEGDALVADLDVRTPRPRRQRRSVGRARRPSTRCHSSGPLRGQRHVPPLGSLNQLMAGPPNRPDSSWGSSTQSSWLSSTPSTTAGSFSSGPRARCRPPRR